MCDNNDCKTCHDKSFASNEKCKFWSDKNILKPRQVFKSSSSKKYVFNCNCGHLFENYLCAVSKGIWCNYCGKKELCNETDCDMCFNMSFLSSDKAKFWSDINKVKPRQTFKNSHDKYWFNCNFCNHIFEKSLSSISGHDGWCPYCANQKLCDNTNCKECFEKSFASSDKVKYWSTKNELKPRECFINSSFKYLFNCDCEHTFNMQISHISKGSWCGYCSNPSKLLCNKENCNNCFEKSFASSDKVKYWSIKNELNPRDVFKHSAKAYIFNCSNGHEFTQQLQITSNGCWCPYCVNKTECKLYDLLIIDYPQLKNQFKIEWCKNKQNLPFDFVLEDYKIIIELDGLQHFKQISNWTSPVETHINDKYKMKCANANDFSVIRLLQTDVFYDTYNWLIKLKENIEKIKSENIIQNIYMCKNNEYEIFIDILNI